MNQVHVKLQTSRRLETFLAKVTTPLQSILRLAVHQKVSLQGVLLVEDEVAGGAIYIVPQTFSLLECTSVTEGS